ncbi:MAG: D-glycero-beta-D-manno-heptose-7-phosphate kinase [Alphaproteobacteria bacterium]|nr:D-glycero-beta-D-manno-heptose-7-phosphate kinase [Alphaproteobacteria bacterium]
MSERSDLADIVARLSGVRVAVIGDVMLDRYIYGAVERVSPEAPIPVLRVEREQAMLGGAGNVARNLSALGAATTLVGVIGADADGAAVVSAIGELPHATSGLVVDPRRPTTLKTRFVAGGQQLLRADRETALALSAESEAALEAAVERAVDWAGVVVLSDYAKGVLEDAMLRRAIERARDEGKPVIVDPRGSDYRRYRRASLVTPNRHELELASGAALPRGAGEEADGAVEQAARRVLMQAGIDAMLVTRSEQGMTLVQQAGRPVHLAAEAREVFDVSGAGDTVVAVLAAALGAGAALADAARLANTVAGIVVGKVGTAVAYPDEVLHQLRAEEVMGGEAKVLGLEAALDRVAGWRRKGLRVGFTNGCFDLLHPGHVSLLAQARAGCDRLIVGLNSDSSVARLKGPGRPVQGEAARALVLASLQSVDMVVVFADDTPIELIRAIRPDVLIKGADYTVATVVGADIVQAYGGKVMLAEIVPGHSTSATIKRLSR